MTVDPADVPDHICAEQGEYHPSCRRPECQPENNDSTNEFGTRE